MDMGKNNFMTAGTVIEDLADKKQAILIKVGNVIAEAVVERAKDDNVNASMQKDIMNLLVDFSDGEKAQILAQVVLNLAMAGKFSAVSKTEKHNDNRTPGTNIFGSRQRY